MNDTDDTSELHRIPGLFRRWELAQVLEPGADYHIEDAGETRDGTSLLAIYCRALPSRKLSSQQ